MEEDLPTLRQAFSLCLWLQLNTKLETTIFLDGSSDVIEIVVLNGKVTIVNFKLDAFSKKSTERVTLEVKLLVAQLMELKSNKHYHNK